MSSVRSRTIPLSILPALTVALIAPVSLQANAVQQRLCRAAISLGHAESRLALFGRLMNGQLPADQQAQILINISDAAAEIRAAMQGIEEPFRTEWARDRPMNNLLDHLDRFAELTADRDYLQRAADIDGSRQVLRSIVAQTFVSSRSDAFRSQANCDRFAIDACYYYGKATIASGFDDRESVSYRDSALGSMRLAIGEGLAIAMDRDGHLPFDGHRKKQCCTFGTPAGWTPFLTFNSSSSVTVFAQGTGRLLELIGNAVQLDPVCTADNAWDRAADDAEDGRDEKEQKDKALTNNLVSRGEAALKRCQFAEVQQILNQLAAIAPADPRHQSLRARFNRLRGQEQEALRLLREASSYTDLTRAVQLLEQAQQTLPCPNAEISQAISSAITEAASARREATAEQRRNRQAAWTSVLGGIVQAMEQASGSGGSSGSTTATGVQNFAPCSCKGMNLGRVTTHSVRSGGDLRCPTVTNAEIKEAGRVANWMLEHQGAYLFACGYRFPPAVHGGGSIRNYMIRAMWTTHWRGITTPDFTSTDRLSSERNAYVIVDRIRAIEPSLCQSFCQAAWDLLRQVEPLGAAPQGR